MCVLKLLSGVYTVRSTLVQYALNRSHVSRSARFHDETVLAQHSLSDRVRPRASLGNVYVELCEPFRRGFEMLREYQRKMLATLVCARRRRLQYQRRLDILRRNAWRRRIEVFERKQYLESVPFTFRDSCITANSGEMDLN